MNKIFIAKYNNETSVTLNGGKCSITENGVNCPKGSCDESFTGNLCQVNTEDI